MTSSRPASVPAPAAAAARAARHAVRRGGGGPVARGFKDVPDSLERDSGLLACRGAIENRFLDALRTHVPIAAADTAQRALDELQLEPAGDDVGSISYFPGGRRQPRPPA
ncbi:hypothetical protein ACFXDH_50110 [Streptomyces sp. NPDC059467]|uniref:hypothetical protein n=1 Tax=Streptomyces sp. NPDC059467 TaxID=3346844 RepID=UPI00368DB295